MKIMTEDKRRIRELRSLKDSFGSVGNYIEEIIPYEENGEMASVIWFALIRGGEVIKRVSSKYVAEVIYFN